MSYLPAPHSRRRRAPSETAGSGSQGNEQTPPPLSGQGRQILEDRCEAVTTKFLDWVDKPHRVREDRPLVYLAELWY